VSTIYYALFHFILDEVGQRVVGIGADLQDRRRLLARTVSHRAVASACTKISGAQVDRSVERFMRSGPGVTPVTLPRFVRDLAKTFLDAQQQREDADYDLSSTIGLQDVLTLRDRVRRVIGDWRSANSPSDRDAKQATCGLIVLRGQLRASNADPS
jgi:hypothetical protein